MVWAYYLPYVGKYQHITGANTGWKKTIIIASYSPILVCDMSTSMAQVSHESIPCFEVLS